MFCVFISNCQGNAIARTRAILDRYASRIGQFAWQTPITLEALESLHLALRRGASRNTSVACYRNAANDGMVLVWLVGNRGAYDERGRYAVATTAVRRSVPMAFRHAALLARAAGLTHDLGKANRRFQAKIRGSDCSGVVFSGDAIRHEWISAWLVRDVMASGAVFDRSALSAAWAVLGREGFDPRRLPVETLCCMKDALLLAVATHHGLFEKKGNTISYERHVRDREAKFEYSKTIGSLLTQKNEVLNLPKADAVRWDDLLSRLRSVLRRLEAIDRSGRYWEGVMLIARAALVLADHAVSAVDYDWAMSVDRYDPDGIPMANSSCVGGGRLNQPLSWHLVSVADQAERNVRMFIGDDLPGLDSDLCRSLLAVVAGAGSRFAWQDVAVDFVRARRRRSLVFNVGTTGSGKTIANLKIAVALREGEPVRLSFAFNLRTLTKQTFAAFRKHVGSGPVFDRDFAILMGDRGVSPLADSLVEIPDDAPEWGETDVDIDGVEGLAIPPWLSKIIEGNPRMEKLVASPVLVSTVDYLVAAGEPGQQGRHAKALLRVSSSDLVLDEVDSYSVESLTALLRLIQISAMFGRNVIVSSATLSAELAEVIARAWRAGYDAGAAMFDLDGYDVVAVSDMCVPRLLATGEVKDGYIEYMKEAAETLALRGVARRFEVRGEGKDETVTFKLITKYGWDLHRMNHVVRGGLRLSIGLIRIANVRTVMSLSDAIAGDPSVGGRLQWQVRVCAYHARDLVLRRARKEEMLDGVLDRTDVGSERGLSEWWERLDRMMPWLAVATGDVSLIVVASPVEEVGRDHDFDWSIIEPSSMHSIIQTAGRVNRHRLEALAGERVNVVVMNKNFQAMKGNEMPFRRPGLQIAKGTHDPAMNVMMRPVGGDGSGAVGGVLDGRLIFDFGGARVRFARDDDVSVVAILAESLRILERVGKSGLLFLTTGFEKERLRSSDGTIDIDVDVRLPDDRGVGVFSVREKKRRGRKSGGKVRDRGVVVWRDGPDPVLSQWLAVDLGDDTAVLSLVLKTRPRGDDDGHPGCIEILWNGVKHDGFGGGLEREF